MRTAGSTWDTVCERPQSRHPTSQGAQWSTPAGTGRAGTVARLASRTPETPRVRLQRPLTYTSPRTRLPSWRRGTRPSSGLCLSFKEGPSVRGHRTQTGRVSVPVTAGLRADGRHSGSTKERHSLFPNKMKPLQGFASGYLPTQLGPPLLLPSTCLAPTTQRGQLRTGSTASAPTLGHPSDTWGFEAARQRHPPAAAMAYSSLPFTSLFLVPQA